MKQHEYFGEVAKTLSFYQNLGYSFTSIKVSSRNAMNKILIEVEMENRFKKTNEAGRKP